jgi:hypothetical protein
MNKRYLKRVKLTVTKQALDTLSMCVEESMGIWERERAMWEDNTTGRKQMKRWLVAAQKSLNKVQD